MHSWGLKIPSFAIYVTKLKLVEPGVSECSMMISVFNCDVQLYGELYNDIGLIISL